MSDILIRCPVAGIPVQTGLSTEKVVFRSLPNISFPTAVPSMQKSASVEAARCLGGKSTPRVIRSRQTQSRMI
jgi:hypothetical protein